MLNSKLLWLFLILNISSSVIPVDFGRRPQGSSCTYFEGRPPLFAGCYVFKEVIDHGEFHKGLTTRKFKSNDSLFSVPYFERMWNSSFRCFNVSASLIYSKNENFCFIKIYNFNKEKLEDILLLQDPFREKRAPSIAILHDKRLIILLGDCLIVWNAQLRRCVQIINKQYNRIFFSNDYSRLYCSIHDAGSDWNFRYWDDKEKFDVYSFFNSENAFQDLTAYQIDFLIHENNERFCSAKSRQLIRSDFPDYLNQLLISVDPIVTTQRICSVKERFLNHDEKSLLNQDKKSVPNQDSEKLSEDLEDLSEGQLFNELDVLDLAPCQIM